jgi:proteasome lid subunit RPN8/RPN11
MQQAAAQFGEWRHARCPFAIECARTALEHVRRHVLEGFYSMPRGGAEAGGVLFGRRVENRVRIMAARPAVCEHAFGPTFTLSIRDEAALQQLLDSAGKGDLAGLQVVGWYHSHTRTDLHLSDHDMDIWKRYFPQPWQVALVLRPAGVGLMRGAYFFREPDGSVRQHAPYAEFEIYPLQEDVPENAFHSYQPEAPPAYPPILEPQHSSAPAFHMKLQTAPPRFLIREVSNSPRRYWAALILAAAAGGAAYVAGDYWEQIAPLWRKPAVNMRMEKDRESLVIRWNPDAGAVENATGATLRIEDGDTTSAVTLDRGLLRRGMREYKPVSGNVLVRLILRQPDGQTVVESAAP